MLDDREIERRLDELHDDGMLPYQLRDEADKIVAEIHSTRDLANAILCLAVPPAPLLWHDTVTRATAILEAWERKPRSV